MSRQLVIAINRTTIDSLSFPGGADCTTCWVSILVGRIVQCRIHFFLFWRGPPRLIWLVSLAWVTSASRPTVSSLRQQNCCRLKPVNWRTAPTNQVMNPEILPTHSSNCTPYMQIQLGIPPPCFRLAFRSFLRLLPPGPESSNLTLGTWWVAGRIHQVPWSHADQTHQSPRVFANGRRTKKKYT